MRWVNIYEEYRNVIHDALKVKHTFRKVGTMRIYICEFSLESEVNSIGMELARKFYLVKSYSSYEKKPHRFDIKNGDIVRCFYTRNIKHEHFTLNQIVSKRNKEIIYPHLCFKEKPLALPLFTLYE